MSQFHKTIATVLLALVAIIAPKASQALPLSDSESKPALIKTGSFTRDQMRFEATIVSTGFTCERGWDQPSDQAGNIVFDPDHCTSTGYSCAVIMAVPFNDGLGRSIGVARKDYAADNKTTEAACQQNVASFYNSLSSAPLHYSIFRVDENSRLIRVTGVGETYYYFYSGK